MADDASFTLRYPKRLERRQEVGYTCWEAIKKAMEKQAARPLCERLQLFEKWYADPEGYKKEHSI